MSNSCTNSPGYTAFLRRLSNFARVITFDKRGQGLSDRISDAPSLEQRIDDVRAVMDEVGSKQAVLLGFSEGSPMSALFAATYPDRVSKLILFGGYASNTLTEEAIAQRFKLWGTGVMARTLFPDRLDDQEAVNQIAKFERLSASPGTFKAYMALVARIDVRSILPAIRVPTLVLHRRTDALIPVERGRDLAAQIPGAKYIEYPSGSHMFWSDDVEAMLGDIEEFVTGHRESSESELERVLATVLFTDIVDSTRSAAEMGDKTWRRLLDSHDQLAKTDGREASRQPDQDHRRRHSGDVRRTGTCGPLRAGFWRGGQTDRIAAARGAAYRRSGSQGKRYRRHCRACRRPRDESIRRQRGSGFARRHRPGRRRGPEIQRARRA